MNVQDINFTDIYQYRGFHNGTDHDEVCKCTNNNLEDRTVTFKFLSKQSPYPQEIATSIEEDGDVLCISKNFSKC